MLVVSRAKVTRSRSRVLLGTSSHKGYYVVRKEHELAFIIGWLLGVLIAATLSYYLAPGNFLVGVCLGFICTSVTTYALRTTK